MKLVITGGAGHISKPLALSLLKAGHQVTVMGRNPENLDALIQSGAIPAIGSLEDASFVRKAFSGADAVYLMIPPNLTTNDFRGYQQRIISNYVEAVKANQVKKLVVLSSIGAHLGKGAGPVDGLADLEQAILRDLPSTDAVFLRPAFFLYNLYQQADLVKQMGIMGANYAMNREKLYLVDPSDIAEAAFHWLDQASFTGNIIYNLYSDEKSTDEIAARLSEAIGKPGTPWVAFPDDQALAAMIHAGLKPDMAKDFVDMGIALREGQFQADFRANGAHQGKKRFEDFVPSFVAFFHP
jgi:uncharacterized protein YbjT (DUF2867 family)